MIKLEHVKNAVSFVASFGVSKIIKEIIVNNVEVDSTLEKGAVYVGQLATTMMVNDILHSYTDAKIDKIAKSIKKIITRTKELQAEKV